MKSRYLDIMARVVDVYTPERFDAYIAKNKADGISEHGFPRLCANIGILMAHSRMMHLKNRFEEMMDICCRDIPEYTASKNKRGNDFSVREILSCILELEAAKLYPAETIAQWKSAIARVDPKSCYRMVAPTPPVPVGNWAAFNAAGEQLRCTAGLSDSHAYIDNQIASQMFSFDENGMYRDPNEPMVYDLVARNMLAACLYHGYKGKHAQQLETFLLKAIEPTLRMQSVIGEIPYGGRSNQFLHNEAHIAACLEFAATLLNKHGNSELAGKCKASVNLALNSLERWLNEAPGQHIKNYYPPDSKIGCEKYAYYDKYMVTVASFLYLAYQFCDDSIAPTTCPASDSSCHTWQSSEAFRKLFCKAANYFMELELRSDDHYDAAGIGRIHRRGSPSAICLSVPSSKSPNYKLETPNPMPLSICCGIKVDGKWHYGFDEYSHFTVTEHYSTDTTAYAKLACILPCGNEIQQEITMNEFGVDITVTGDSDVCLSLPVFIYDGKNNTKYYASDHILSVSYKNWSCKYTSDGRIADLFTKCANRNGVYQIFRAEAHQKLHVHVAIEPLN